MAKHPVAAKGSGYSKNPQNKGTKTQRQRERELKKRHKEASKIVDRGGSRLLHAFVVYGEEALVLGLRLALLSVSMRTLLAAARCYFE
jgi:hypothetical protein